MPFVVSMPSQEESTTRWRDCDGVSGRARGDGSRGPSIWSSTHTSLTCACLLLWRSRRTAWTKPSSTARLDESFLVNRLWIRDQNIGLFVMLGGCFYRLRVLGCYLLSLSTILQLSNCIITPLISLRTTLVGGSQGAIRMLGREQMLLNACRMEGDN